MSLKNEIKHGALLALKLGAIGVVLITLFVASSRMVSKLDKPLDIKAIAERSMFRYDILGVGTCSATVVAPDLAITAAHCIPSLAEIYALATQGRIDFSKPLLSRNGKPLQVVYMQANSDQALIRGDFSDKVRVLVDDYDGKLFKEKEVVVCGYPAFNEQIRCEKQEKLHYGYGFSGMHSGTVLRGQSGGAVFSKDMSTLIGTIYGVDEAGFTISNSLTGFLSTAKKATGLK
jgi:hypothetical protein